MAHFPPVSPGTESSVPGAAVSQGGQGKQALHSPALLLTPHLPHPIASTPPPPPTATATVVALQSMLAAMTASLNATTAALDAPTDAAATSAAAPATAPVVPVAPAVVVPAAPPGFANQAPWIAGTLYVVVPGPLMPLLVPGPDDKLWYCITRGHYVGVTLSNALALAAVTGVSANRMNSYTGQAAAIAAFNELLGYNLVSVVPRT